jgi:hypothetical protein
MSGKNRALGLAIATAALVGFSAPMASAATIAGPSNSGFNNDSILNLSGNQVPIQTCTFGALSNAASILQTIAPIAAPLVAPTDVLDATTGDVNGSQTAGCAQTPSQTETSSLAS